MICLFFERFCLMIYLSSISAELLFRFVWVRVSPYDRESLPYSLPLFWKVLPYDLPTLHFCRNTFLKQKGVALWSTSSGRVLPYDLFWKRCFAYDLPTFFWFPFIVFDFLSIFILILFFFVVVSSFLDMFMLVQHNHLAVWKHGKTREEKTTRRRRQINITLSRTLMCVYSFFVGGCSLLGSDLQVICVWCVFSFSFVCFHICQILFFLVFLLCLSVFPVTKAPPAHEKLGVFYGFWLCCLVFEWGVSWNPKRTPPKNWTKKPITKRGRVRLPHHLNLLNPKPNKNKTKKGKGYVAVGPFWCSGGSGLLIYPTLW